LNGEAQDAEAVWILRGDRVGLSTPTKEEFVSRWERFNDPVLAGVLTLPTTRPSAFGMTRPPFTREQRESMWGLMESRDFLPFDVRLVESGECIGEIQLMGITWPHASGVLAVVIFDARHRGQGFGTEATKLLCAYAFDGLGLHRIELQFVVDNPAVAGAVERSIGDFGGRRIGVARDAVWTFGRHRDVMLVEILATDFPPAPDTAHLRAPPETRRGARPSA